MPILFRREANNSMASAPSPECVFINCPFDDAYLPLFRPLVFTVRGLGLKPRMSWESADSGKVRIDKIIGLIRESEFGIHDLSRCKAQKKGEVYRMNMPLELGYDLGAKAYGGKPFVKKKVLILEAERYSLQEAVSDLAGCDCKAHSNEPEEIVYVVRDWLVQEAKAPKISASSIWYAFADFTAWNHDDLLSRKYSSKEIDRMGMAELDDRMAGWLEDHPLV